MSDDPCCAFLSEHCVLLVDNKTLFLLGNKETLVLGYSSDCRVFCLENKVMYSSLMSSVTSLSGGPVRVQDVKIQFTHSFLTITEVPQKIMLKPKTNYSRSRKTEGDYHYFNVSLV